MFMTIEKYQKNWTFTISSDFGKYSVTAEVWQVNSVSVKLKPN